MLRGCVPGECDDEIVASESHTLTCSDRCRDQRRGCNVLVTHTDMSFPLFYMYLRPGTM
jgi:hypothetical protein